MIGNGVEVHRSCELHVETRRVCNRLTPRKTIGIIGCGQRTKGITIERVRGMHMQITKERFAFYRFFKSDRRRFTACGGGRRLLTQEEFGFCFKHFYIPAPDNALTCGLSIKLSSRGNHTFVGVQVFRKTQIRVIGTGRQE